MFDGYLIRYLSNMKRTAPGPFEALADPTRRAILRRLRSGPLSAGEVGEAFSLTKATLSHHFRILRAAGLVRSEKRGTSVIYTLQSNVLEDVASELLELVERVKPARRARKVTP
jgi:DNA-binding transcriptional ArsR family regulator